ncbi:hypothetical protein GCM10027589_01890 [Actinocorallia lasiicapitis]
MARTPRGRALLASLLCFAVIAWSPGIATAAGPFDDMCAGPLAALEQTRSKIRSHNASPPDRRNAAAVSAYNARARGLMAEQTQNVSRARQCVNAFAEVLRNNPARRS